MQLQYETVAYKELCIRISFSCSYITNDKRTQEEIKDSVANAYFFVAFFSVNGIDRHKKADWISYELKFVKYSNFIFSKKKKRNIHLKRNQH